MPATVENSALNKRLGSLIKQARGNLELTQADVGEHLGVTRVAVGYWERGATVPRLDLFLKLIAYLDIDVAELAAAAA